MTRAHTHTNEHKAYGEKNELIAYWAWKMIYRWTIMGIVDVRVEIDSDELIEMNKHKWWAKVISMNLKDVK